MKIFASLTAAVLLSAVAALPAQSQTVRRCNQFATQPEAQYHLMMGFAGAELDDDGDGVACEMLPSSVAEQGYESNRNVYSAGYGYYLRQSQGIFYLEAVYQGQVVFTALPFRSQNAAEQYGRRFIPANSRRAAQVLSQLSGN